MILLTYFAIVRSWTNSSFAISWLLNPLAASRYLPDPYPLSEAHHYTYGSFMDTWELYRITSIPEAVAYMADTLNLPSAVTVHEFPLIISRPPPYWWRPEALQEAQLYRSEQQDPDGRRYDLLYSAGSGVAYLVRFDG